MRSISCAWRPRRSAARAVAAGPTWRRPAAQMAPRPMRRWPRSKRRWRGREPAMLTIRRAEADDAQAIGAVFDAAVREGWKYMGELASRPMFPPEEWDEEVAKHAPPNALLVAANEPN